MLRLCRGVRAFFGFGGSYEFYPDFPLVGFGVVDSVGDPVGCSFDVYVVAFLW